eukprot:349910-Rhodomonas_salina.1
MSCPELHGAQQTMHDDIASALVRCDQGARRTCSATKDMSHPKWNFILLGGWTLSGLTARTN